MNRDHPLLLTDKSLYAKVFKYATSTADCRYFRQRIVDFIKGNTEGQTLSQYMFHSVWERNNQGRTLKYCFFDEPQQKVKLDHYFYEWMKRTVTKAETELKSIQTMNNDNPQQKGGKQ